MQCVKKTAGLPGPVLERVVKPLDILDDWSQLSLLCEHDVAVCGNGNEHFKPKRVAQPVHVCSTSPHD